MKKRTILLILTTALVIFFLYRCNSRVPDGVKTTTNFSSSVFNMVGYDDKEEVLYVCFKKSSDSRYYCYYDFPEQEYEKFINAPSLGKYYNRHIKGKYRSKRIDY